MADRLIDAGINLTKYVSLPILLLVVLAKIVTRYENRHRG
jgi:hypothetical protein